MRDKYKDSLISHKLLTTFARFKISHAHFYEYGWGYNRSFSIFSKK